jgi:hypothetical protein
MSLTCPACAKPNQNGELCQRCGCDLSDLHAVNRAAEWCLRAGREHLRRAAWLQALQHAEQSWDLQHSAAAARDAFVLAAALGDTVAALRWHRRAARDPAAES